MSFKRDWPGTQSIRFTQEGSVSGAGSWSANAVVTIAGKDYDEILGPEQLIGQDLPSPDATPASESLTVHYSDGTSEVIE